MGKGVGNGGGEGEVEFTRGKEGMYLSRVQPEAERVSFAGGGKSAGAIGHDDDGRIFFFVFSRSGEERIGSPQRQVHTRLGHREDVAR